MLEEDGRGLFAKEDSMSAAALRDALAKLHPEADVRAIAAEVLTRSKALAVVGPFDDEDAFSGVLG